METETWRTLIADIEQFLAEHQMAESTFGLRAVNNGKLMSRLRNNGSVTITTLDRIRAFMRDHEETASSAVSRRRAS
jgi:hypothetical protein